MKMFILVVITIVAFDVDVVYITSFSSAHDDVISIVAVAIAISIDITITIIAPFTFTFAIAITNTVTGTIFLFT